MRVIDRPKASTLCRDGKIESWGQVKLSGTLSGSDRPFGVAQHSLEL